MERSINISVGILTENLQALTGLVALVLSHATFTTQVRTLRFDDSHRPSIRFKLISHNSGCLGPPLLTANSLT